jgi:predicted amidophosphoribosyltransferase
MPRSDYSTCRNCGRHRDDCGEMSHTRLCSRCAAELLEENIDGIHAKSGRAWARWQIGMALSALRNPGLVNALIDAGAFAYAGPNAGGIVDDVLSEE